MSVLRRTLVYDILDTNNPYHDTFEFAETWVKEVLLICGVPLPQELLLLAPIALSIGAKVVFDELATIGYRQGRELKIMVLIVMMSVGISKNFFNVQAQIRAGEGMWLQNPSPDLPMIMHTWAEETNRIWGMIVDVKTTIHMDWMASEPGLASNTTAPESQLRLT
jgi:hypothetical protein